MQTNNLDTQELADTLEQSEVHAVIDTPGLRMHVLTFDKQDILIFTPGTGGISTVVYPCASFDAESGGSIHDHARAGAF